MIYPLEWICNTHSEVLWKEIKAQILADKEYILISFHKQKLSIITFMESFP